MAPLSAAAGSNSKLPLVENERSSIKVPPEIDVTWCMPDLYLLKKLKLIAEKDHRGNWPMIDSEEEALSSEEESEETVSTGSLAAVELDVAVWSRFPHDLLQKVIPKLSLRSLYGISSFSKQWRLRVCSPSFQDEVNSSLIASGRSFCPLFVIRNMQVFLGFESSSRQWFRLPTLSYLPEEVHNSGYIAACGPLLCLTGRGFNDSVFVTNPITRSWTRLPPGPDPYEIGNEMQIVSDEGSKTYKVFINSWSPSYVIWIFDSSDNSWTRVNSSFGHIAVINGVLYQLTSMDYPVVPGRRSSVSCSGINSFDLNEKVWKGASCLYQIFPENPEKPPQPFEDCTNGWRKLLVCGSKLILVTKEFEIISGRSGYTDSESENDSHSDNDQDNHNDSDNDSSNSSNSDNSSYCHSASYKNGMLFVYELDLDNWCAFELSRATLELLNLDIRYAICHGDCIYIGYSFPSLLFNVKTREWVWPYNGKGLLKKVYNVATGKSAWSYLRKGMLKSDMHLSEKYINRARGWLWVPTTYKPGLI